ncbi:MAG TPA: class F sortase, partial [Actinomycetota bacterium]|nr:class F sortase [Actinomycetota bacterium]
MPRPGRARGDRRQAAPSALPALLALALLVTGCAAGPSEPSAAPAISPPAEAAPGPRGPGPEPVLPRGARPEAVAIPAIGVSSPLVRLG